MAEALDDLHINGLRRDDLKVQIDGGLQGRKGKQPVSYSAFGTLNHQYDEDATVDLSQTDGLPTYVRHDTTSARKYVEGESSRPVAGRSDLLIPSHPRQISFVRTQHDEPYSDGLEIHSDRYQSIQGKTKTDSQLAFEAFESSDDEDSEDSEPDLDPDDELLQPSEWLSSIKTIERTALQHSYFWQLYNTRVKERELPVNIKHSSAHHTFIPGTTFDSNGLPSICSVRCLSGIYEELLSVGTLVHFHLSSTRPTRTSKTEVRMELSVSQHILKYVGRPTEVLCNILSPHETFLPILPGLESLVISRQILIAACHSIELLREAGICAGRINVLACDRTRVVKIVPIELAKVVKLLTLLNTTIRCLLWGWLEGFTLGHKDEPCLCTEKQPSTLFDSITYIKIQKDGSMADLEGFWSVLARAIDFSIVSFSGSHLTSNVANHLNLHKQQSFPISIDKRGEQPSFFTGFEYTPVTLECLDTFLLGRNVWVLQNTHYRIRGNAFVSSSIEDFSDLWGPVVRLDKKTSKKDEPHGCYYALGTGAIGLDRNRVDVEVQILPNEILCHYVPSILQMESELDLIDENETAMLLIGAPVSTGLSVADSCPIKQLESLKKVPLRPRGTTGPSRFKASTTYAINAGYSGSSVGVARQYQYRDGMTQKQRILAKWLKSPGSTHPDSLLMWHGLEISACTKNARRRQLWDIIRSEPVVRAFKHGLFEWKEPECELAFDEVLFSEDPKSFSKLYLGQKRWRKQLGQAISWILELLSDTGIGMDGNLHAFTFMDDSHDPERIGILSSKKHSWTPFIKDSLTSTTFAIISPLCLSFPYPDWGQQCRTHECKRTTYSVLETAIVPEASSDMADSKWVSCIPSGKHISLCSSAREMLKLVRHLPEGQLLVEWTDSEYIKALAVRFSGPNQVVRFVERSENSDYQNHTFAVVFVLSKNKNDLAETADQSTQKGVADFMQVEEPRNAGKETQAIPSNSSTPAYPPEKVSLMIERSQRTGSLYSPQRDSERG